MDKETGFGHVSRNSRPTENNNSTKKTVCNAPGAGREGGALSPAPLVAVSYTHLTLPTIYSV